MQLIQCPCESLLTPLKRVEGIVERRQTLPIISNVLIQVADEKITFVTTDLDIQIRTTSLGGIPGVNESFTVSAENSRAFSMLSRRSRPFRST